MQQPNKYLAFSYFTFYSMHTKQLSHLILFIVMFEGINTTNIALKHEKSVFKPFQIRSCTLPYFIGKAAETLRIPIDEICIKYTGDDKTGKPFYLGNVGKNQTLRDYLLQYVTEDHYRGEKPIYLTASTKIMFLVDRQKKPQDLTEEHIACLGTTAVEVKMMLVKDSYNDYSLKNFNGRELDDEEVVIVKHMNEIDSYLNSYFVLVPKDSGLCEDKSQRLPLTYGHAESSRKGEVENGQSSKKKRTLRTRPRTEFPEWQ